jgi:nitrous oxide reductase
MKSPWIIVAIIAVLALGGYLYMQKNAPAPAQDVAGGTVPAGSGDAVDAADVPVKEFTMTAYYDEKGKWFSLKEMTVKKGDRVRIKITNTKGMHDLVIDEYGINKELPMNEEVVIDFVADKAGSFVYYCSKAGHRAGGQWGTLTVSE